MQRPKVRLVALGPEVPCEEMKQDRGRIPDRADLKLLGVIDRLLTTQRRWGFQFSTDYRRLLMGEPLETRTTRSDASLKTFRDMLVGAWIVVGVLAGVAGLVFLQFVHLDGLLGVVASTFWGFVVGGPFAMSILRGVPERLWRRVNKTEDSLVFVLWARIRHRLLVAPVRQPGDVVGEARGSPRSGLADADRSGVRQVAGLLDDPLDGGHQQRRIGGVADLDQVVQHDPLALPVAWAL